MRNDRYDWINSNTQPQYRILRIQTEGQCHLEDFISLLTTLEGAYTPWAEAYEWQALARNDIENSLRTYGKQFFKFHKRMPGLEPIEDEIAAAILAASVYGRPGKILIESVRSQPVDDRNRLILDRCVLASPGNIDLLGVGKALEVIAKFINDCLDRKTARRKVEAETEEIQQRTRKTAAETRAAQLENIGRGLDLIERLNRKAEELDYSPEARRALFDGYLKAALPPLVRHIDSGAIYGAEILELNDAHSDRSTT